MTQLALWGWLIPLCTACVSEESEIDRMSPEGVICFSSQLQIMKGAAPVAANEAPTPGEYYLGYRENKQPAIKSVTIGKDGDVTTTGYYWSTVSPDEGKTNEATFTLSNIKDKETELANKDILWANDIKWGGNLKFILNHLMSQVRVELTLDAEVGTIQKVMLTHMGIEVNFDRTAGEVTTVPSTNSIELTLDATGKYYYAYLPPQFRDKQDRMQLKVVTDKGAYARKLPFAMSQDIGGGIREDIPLEFRKGYVLTLEANVTNTPDLTVLFTGATLKDWQNVGTSTIPAKPAGIYTEKDLIEWAKAYQRGKEETNFQLEKYGTYSGGQWTFTLIHSVTVTSVPASPYITDFRDKLMRRGSAIIKGVTQAQFMTVTSPGTVDSDIFETK